MGSGSGLRVGGWQSLGLICVREGAGAGFQMGVGISILNDLVH